ncbi:MAG: TolC family protein, partial [Planctomycetota bacterium]
STLLENRLYQAEIREFENGMSTSTDVLEAQTNFTNAQSTEINALAEYQISLVDLGYATGTLLGAAGVDWQPTAPSVPVK